MYPFPLLPILPTPSAARPYPSPDLAFLSQVPKQWKGPKQFGVCMCVCVCACCRGGELHECLRVSVHDISVRASKHVCMDMCANVLSICPSLSLCPLASLIPSLPPSLSLVSLVSLFPFPLPLSLSHNDDDDNDNTGKTKKKQKKTQKKKQKKTILHTQRMRMQISSCCLLT